MQILLLAVGLIVSGSQLAAATTCTGDGDTQCTSFCQDVSGTTPQCDQDDTVTGNIKSSYYSCHCVDSDGKVKSSTSYNRQSSDSSINDSGTSKTPNCDDPQTTKCTNFCSSSDGTTPNCYQSENQNGNSKQSNYSCQCANSDGKIVSETSWSQTSTSRKKRAA